MYQVQKVLTVGTVCSIFAFLISFYLTQPDDELQARLINVLSGLIEVERQYESYKPKVAVGYGSCQDLLVEGKNFLLYNASIGNPEHFDDISSLIELYKSYAYYFKHGAASERYVPNEELFDELVARASKVEGARFALGGNAPVMATRFHKEGCEVIMASTLTPQLLNSLPRNLEVVGEQVDRDDVHLILEYKAGEKWGPYTAPRANRYILHNDNNNPLVSSLQSFGVRLKGFGANLLVVSGLQMMDGYPFQPGVREKRLLAIRTQMMLQPPATRVHFELASFSDPQLLQQLTDTIVPQADSLGMNEQELANALSMYKYGNISHVSDSTPRVAIVLDQMRHLFKLVRTRNSEVMSSRQLSRIHVHTLAYQAVLTAHRSPWKHSDIAAAKASLTAYRHVCASAEVDVSQARLLMDASFCVQRGEAVGGVAVEAACAQRVFVQDRHPVACWEERNYRVCVAPGLVCTRAKQTVGGGDNISAAALAVQL